MKDFLARKERFLSITGLKISKAGLKKILNFMPKYHDPVGFDHTRCFYYPPQKIHLIMTEPYRSVDDAVNDVNRLAQYYGDGAAKHCFVMGADGAGLWNPPDCKTLMIARAEHRIFLEMLAALLPIVIK